ncbi:MAG: glycosyltransferase family 2 protein, partial [Promethearchaeota archaeon]
MSMPPFNPTVYVVILNWNGYDDTTSCLDSFRKVTYPCYRIVVVDNGSERDEGRLIKKKYGDFVQVIRCKKNLGFAGGSNLGIRWALKNDSDYILLLNNDTVVDAPFLTELVNAAEKDNKIGIVGPKVYNFYAPKEIHTAGGKINFWTGNAPCIGRGQKDNGKFDHQREVEYVSGCALMIKSHVLRKTGLLNEKYFAYYEETELCTIARRLGYKVVYVPSAKIWHKISSSSESELSFYYMIRNRFLFMKRNANALQYFTF